MSTYPGAIDRFSEKRDYVDIVLAAHINALQASVRAIQATLGVQPAQISDASMPGTLTSVADVLDALATQIRRIIGANTWTDAPATNLAALSALPQRRIDAGPGLTGGGDLSANRTIALQTPGTLSASTTNNPSGNHTHQVQASHAPGAARSLLRTDDAGRVELVGARLGQIDISNNTIAVPNGETIVGGQTARVAPSGTLILAPGSGVVEPSSHAAADLGSSARKWRNVHALNLAIERIVAAEQRAVSGGRLLIGFSARLIDAMPRFVSVLDADTNVFTPGTIVILSSGGVTEYIRINSSGTAITGGWRYTVTRDLLNIHNPDPAWPAGTLIFSTGLPGGGWLELNAGSSEFGLVGPAILAWQRFNTGATDYSVQLVAGNLMGKYDYTTAKFGFAAGDFSKRWVAVDQDAIRLMSGTQRRLFCDGDGIDIESDNYQLRVGANLQLKALAPTSAPPEIRFLERNDLSMRVFAGSAAPRIEAPPVAGRQNARLALIAGGGNFRSAEIELEATTAYASCVIRADSLTILNQSGPPISVNNSAMCNNLNVELWGGWRMVASGQLSIQLSLTAGRWLYTNTQIAIPNTPGNYRVIVSVADAPAIAWVTDHQPQSFVLWAAMDRDLIDQAATPTILWWVLRQ